MIDYVSRETQPTENVGAILLSMCKETMEQAPIVPASFRCGMAWFVAFAAPSEMHWSLDQDRRGYFPAERSIEELGFECFVPRETRKIKRRGRRGEQVNPVLGAYIFVRFDRERDDWHAIRHIPGIHGILSSLDIPIRVADGVVQYFQRCEAAGVFDFTKPRSAFKDGDDVEIKEGPFAGLIGKVRSASPKKRIRVLLDGLGKLDIDPGFLAKVG